MTKIVCTEATPTVGAERSTLEFTLSTAGFCRSAATDDRCYDADKTVVPADGSVPRNIQLGLRMTMTISSE